MPTGVLVVGLDERRSPYGERGLKSTPVEGVTWPTSRSPYGERGLK